MEITERERLFVEGLRAHPDRAEAIGRLLMARKHGDYAELINAVLDAPDGTLETLEEGLAILREQGGRFATKNALLQG